MLHYSERSPRQEQIANQITLVRSRIDAAAARSSRSPGAISLVAVSKKFPFADVMTAFKEGINAFGENRPQELHGKVMQSEAEAFAPPPQFHMIGHLQRNKVKLVTGHAALIQSIDSLRLAEAVSERAETLGIIQPVLLQVKISDDAAKYGIAPTDLGRVLDVVVELSSIRVDGLMGMASFTEDLDVVRSQFERLYKLRERMALSSGAGLKTLSMGMSSDFEVAIEEGATMVRVGSLLFGDRER